MEPRITAQIVALRQAELAAGVGALRRARRGPRLATTFREDRRAGEGR